jgi:signal transduction histidine kinase
MVTVGGYISAINHKACQLLGYQPHELTNTPFKSLCIDDSAVNGSINNIFSNAVEAKIVHVILQGKTQKTFSVDIQISQNTQGKLVSFVAPSSVINDDMLSEHALVEQLKQQNDYLTLAEKAGNLGHWRINIAENTVLWSPEIYRIHGLDKKLFNPTFENTLKLYLASEQGKVSQLFKNSVNKKESFYFKSVIVNSNGEEVKVESIGDVELDNFGQVKSIFGVFRDITKSENAIEKLKLLAMVNHTIKVPIFFIDDGDNVVYKDIAPQHGDERASLFSYLNFSLTEYSHLKNLAKSEGQIQRVNISFDKYTTAFDLSITYEREAGIYIWIVENVTEKFRLEQQQIISTRLTLLGNTFGNVSHDINNVLGVALGSIEMLELKFTQGDTDISGYINQVKNAIDKGKNVTERLLAFTCKPTVKVLDFDPIQEIKENQYLFKQLLLKNIEISYDIENVDCIVSFPQGEFINMLLNLVLNAQDAIQGTGLNGKIHISAKMINDNRLEIDVTDSGVGITEENLTKIFDPFYSNKSVNKGNGIGLATVYNTLYKHNGHIRVNGTSDLGGAHFTIIFKCNPGQKIKTNSADKNNDVNLKGKNILVLDDEKSIAEFVGMYLESLDANVVCVHNKFDLIRYVDSATDIDIFFTDMIMPDLSGIEAVNIVTSKFSQVNIYSMSGYIATENKNWQYPLLRKPFNSKELADFFGV